MKENFFQPKRKTSSQENGFKEKQQNLAELEHKIIRNIDYRRYEIPEQDRIRLTRVLQLIERYKPETRIIPAQEKKLMDVLKDLYRLFPKKKNKKIETQDVKPKDNPYLLAEEAIASLRELRHLDYKLKNFSEENINEDKVLDQEMSGKIISNDKLETSLTLEYEKKNWGIRRICLDGIQNHLKTDSGGQNVWVQCLIEDRWVNLEEAKNQKDKIEKVRFADDGVGFDVKNLVLLWSTKSEEEGSRGQFGEGLKMIAASSVRENLGMELQSQNWSAKPFGKEIEVKNTRKNTTQKIEQLSFDVNHYDQENIIGSRTIFHKPSEEFINEVLNMDGKVLELSNDYKPLFKYIGERGGGDIVNRNGKELFVKGIFIEEEKTIFSYDFDGVEINRDRNAIIGRDFKNRIYEVIKELNDKKLIKTLLQKSVENYEDIECNYYYLETNYPELWKEAFYETFGENACLQTDFNVPEELKEQEKNIRKIKFSENMIKFLKGIGVKMDKEAMPSYKEIIPTSITLEYGKDIWNEERIMLDAIQNHLPQDAEGGSVYLRFKTKDGNWHDFRDLEDYVAEHIESIKIANSGRNGYDSRLLGIFHSMKDHDQSSGKWGEGLKMLSAACLRSDVDLTLKSRNWTANPKVIEQEIDGKKIEQLSFEVIHDLKDGNKKFGGDYHSDSEQSATIFNNPSLKLIDEFRKADQKVLELSSKKKLFTSKNGEILDLKDGELFVRGILIPGEHNLRYSYHLPHFDIKTRDRNHLSEEDLKNEIKEIWVNMNAADIIKDFLYQASLSTKAGSGKEYLEFDSFFLPKNGDLWIETFKNIFGKNTAFRSVKSQNFNEIHELQHVGLDVVTLPDKICQILGQLSTSDGERIENYSLKLERITDVKFVEEENVTDEEKNAIDLLYKLNEFLPENQRHDIKLYERKYHGQEVALGFAGKGGNVNLLREILSDTIKAAFVYFHEKTHAITGAGDADADFRNFLTLALTKLALKQLSSES